MATHCRRRPGGSGCWPGSGAGARVQWSSRSGLPPVSSSSCAPAESTPPVPPGRATAAPGGHGVATSSTQARPSLLCHAATSQARSALSAAYGSDGLSGDRLASDEDRRAGGDRGLEVGVFRRAAGAGRCSGEEESAVALPNTARRWWSAIGANSPAGFRQFRLPVRCGPPRTKAQRRSSGSRRRDGLADAGSFISVPPSGKGLCAEVNGQPSPSGVDRPRATSGVPRRAPVAVKHPQRHAIALKNR